jgi:hypothetical protein
MTRHHTPRRTVRWARGFAVVAAAALTLTGCMKIQTDLTLNPDNTGSMAMIMAISDEFADSMGMDPQDMWDSMSGEMATDAPEGANQEPYAEDGYTGVKYTLAEAPIEQLSTPAMTIERVGDNYVFTGTMDLTDESTDTTDTSDPMTQAMLDTFIVQVSVTFPGAVGETNGEVDGNTVTWTPTLGEVAEMNATGSAIAGAATEPTAEPSETPTDEPADATAEPTDEATADVTASDDGAASSGFPWWLLGVVGAVLVAAVVGIVLLANRGRKEPSPATAYAAPPQGQPQWQGQPPAQTPPQWQGQPGQAQPPQWGQPPAQTPPQWQGQPGQPTPPAQQTPPPPQWGPPPAQTPPPPQAPPAQDWQAQPTQEIQPEPPADGEQPDQGQNPPA